MKTFRNIYAGIGLILIIIVVIIAYVMSKKPSDEQISLQRYSSTEGMIDPSKLQQVKAEFPKGFPLPNDSEISNTRIIPSDSTGGYNFPNSYFLTFKTSEGVDQILETYNKALKAQGLSVITRPSEIGKQVITGKYLKDGVADSIYEIGIIVLTRPNNMREVTLWVNK